MAVRHAAPLLAVITVGVALTSAQNPTPNPGNSGSTPYPSVTSPQTPPPDPPPLPPDVKAPDPPSPPQDPTENPVTRTLKRLAPSCINAIFHACWSGPPEKPLPPQTDETRGAASREVGEYYFERKNYQAAESRFEESVNYNPADAKAMFELGQTLEKLRHPDQAAERYKDCFDLQPDGPYAARAQKAMNRLFAKQNAVSSPAQ